jgi:hypothetical protein
MRRVGPLPTAGGQPLPLTRRHQQRVEQQSLGGAVHQPGAELAQHSAVEAGIGEFESAHVLPVDAGPHRVGGLAIGQVFGVLEEGDQRQPPGHFRRLPTRRQQRRKRRIGKDWADLVAQTQIKMAMRKGARAMRAVCSGTGPKG